MNWVLLWKIVLVFTLSGYSILAVIVIFGGIGNIKDMLRELSGSAGENEE